MKKDLLLLKSRRAGVPTEYETFAMLVQRWAAVFDGGPTLNQHSECLALQVRFCFRALDNFFIMSSIIGDGS